MICILEFTPTAPESGSPPGRRRLGGRRAARGGAPKPSVPRGHGLQLAGDELTDVPERIEVLGDQLTIADRDGVPLLDERDELEQPRRIDDSVLQEGLVVS